MNVDDGVVHINCGCLVTSQRTGRNTKTETAMQRVWSDVLTSADVREVTVLALLDLSAAFDCVDHDILLHGLEVAFGVTNTALEWVCSFLTDRTQQVSYCGRLSPV